MQIGRYKVLPKVAVIVACMPIVLLALPGCDETPQSEGEPSPGAAANVAQKQEASSDETAAAGSRDTEPEGSKADEQSETELESHESSSGESSDEISGDDADKADKMSRKERAAKLNDQGKELWLEVGNLPAAIKKFRKATRLDRKAQYYFNLCYALHQHGKLRKALRACKEVTKRAKEKRLKDKAQTVIEDIRGRSE